MCDEHHRAPVEGWSGVAVTRRQRIADVIVAAVSGDGKLASGWPCGELCAETNTMAQFGFRSAPDR